MPVPLRLSLAVPFAALMMAGCAQKTAQPDTATVVRQEQGQPVDISVDESRAPSSPINAPVPSETSAEPSLGTVSGTGYGTGMAAKAAGRAYGGAAADREDVSNESYAHVAESRFIPTASESTSTFSIDVDAASYANLRRFLTAGQLPPTDAVRVEEMLNYFDYDYAQPTDGKPVAITTETAGCPWNPSHRLVHIGVQARRVETAELPPSNLVFLIDVSGSMQSPDKLPLLKSAFRLLVEQMRPVDRVALVVYAGAAGVVLPSTPGSDKSRILASLDDLEAGGSTAGAEGIERAYAEAIANFQPHGNNRVILATDGDFNVGPSSDAALIELIEKKRRSGVFLSVLGFGTGNLQDSKMEGLADKGNGNYAYIDGISEARKVFVEELGGTLVTLAKDVKIQVQFDPARVRSYKLVGYENRALANRDFEDDTKDAGELGSGHDVTALYEIDPVPGAAADGQIATVRLRYQQPQGSASQLIEQPVRDTGTATGRASEAFRFSAAVAEAGLLLRGSETKADASYADALTLARGAVGSDRTGYRTEFIRLIETARQLSDGTAARDERR